MKKILLYTVFGFTLSFTEAFAEKYCNSAKTCIWESDGQGNVIVTGTGTLESLQGRSADEPIKTVNINGVSEIGQYAFYYLGTLTDVTVGKSVQNIIGCAFCASGTADGLNVNIQGDNVNLGTDSFSTSIKNMDYNAVTYSCGTNCYATLDKDGNATYYGEGEGVLSTGVPKGFIVSTADIGDGVSEIGQYAFYYYKTLDDVIIKGDATKISNSAFANAFASQKEVYCPKALEEVCRSKIGSFAGTYKEKGKDILYYDSTGKLVKKGPNPNYKPKKIYTVEEAMEATKDGEIFHVYLTYK